MPRLFFKKQETMLQNQDCVNACLELPLWMWDSRTISLLEDWVARPSSDPIDLVNPFGAPIFDLIKVPRGTDAVFPTFGKDRVGQVFVVANNQRGIRKMIESDEYFVHTPKFANAIDWAEDYARDRRVDVLSKALEVFMHGLQSQVAASQLALFSEAAGAPMTRADLSEVKVAMGGCVTDMLVEPELMADVRVAVLREEFGDKVDFEDEEYRERFEELSGMKHLEYDDVMFHETHDISNDYGAHHSSDFGVGKKQICFAFDLSNKGVFVMPHRNSQVFPDNSESLKEKNHQGIYGWLEVGMACLDSVAVGVFEEGFKIKSEKSPVLTAAEEAKTSIEKHIDEINAQSCNCGSPRCTWRGSAHCMHGIR